MRLRKLSGKPDSFVRKNQNILTSDTPENP